MTATAGALYFMAAYAALAIQTRSEAIAIFWPAAGIAVGLMLGAGRAWDLPTVLGTIAATFAANSVWGRASGSSLWFGLCNALEAVSIATALRWLSGSDFSIERLACVLRLMLVSAVACAIAAALAAAGIRLVGHSSAPFLDIWQVWLLSDFIGIVVVAPLITTACALVRSPQRHHDWSADIALLLLLGAVAWHAVSLPTGAGSWQAITPGTTVVPVIIWLAVRGQPLAPSIGIVMVGMLMALAASLGYGRYGDPSISVADRALAAQASLAALSLVTLSISALFHERRHAEARLRETNERLATIAGTAPGVMFSLARQAGGRLAFPFLASTADAVLGIGARHLAHTAEPLLERVFPEDRDNLLRALAQAPAEAETFRLELGYCHPAGGERWLEICAAPVTSPRDGLVWHGYLQDITGRRMLTAELNHRTRNLMSVVQSVAQHTARSTDPQSFPRTLGQRIDGLLRCHDLLGAGDWKGADVGDLVRSQFAHLSDLVDSRIVIEGPRLVLKPTAAQIVGMAMHELATNALKYGALSNGSGRVRITWSASEGGANPRLRMLWEEEGGPPVEPARRNGFGSKVTIDMVRYQLDADVDLEVRPAGLVWRLDAPARRTLLKEAA
jgi:two-component sensor histidine kinase